MLFTGTIGLSLSLNRGVQQKTDIATSAQAPPTEDLRLQPA
jgi:hypothetical protein